MTQNVNEKFFKKIIDSNSNSVFVYGDWGIGKTEFALKLYDELENVGYKVIYFDVRGIDLYPSFIEILTKIVDDSDDFYYAKEAVKRMYNITNTMLNGFLKFDARKKDDAEKIKSKIEKVKNTIIIFDELDRIPAQTLLKTLNLINSLRIVAPQIKSVAVGNKSEVEHVIGNGLKRNAQNNEHFLAKYFDEEINLDLIKISACVEAANLHAPYLVKFLEVVSKNRIELQTTKLNARAVIKFANENAHLANLSSDDLMISRFAWQVLGWKATPYSNALGFFGKYYVDIKCVMHFFETNLHSDVFYRGDLSSYEHFIKTPMSDFDFLTIEWFGKTFDEIIKISKEGTVD